MDTNLHTKSLVVWSRLDTVTDLFLLSCLRPPFSMYHFSSLQHTISQLPLGKMAISTAWRRMGWHVNVPSVLSNPHHQETDAFVAPWKGNFWRRSPLGAFSRAARVHFSPSTLNIAVFRSTAVWAPGLHIHLEATGRGNTLLSLVCRTQTLEAELAEMWGARSGCGCEKLGPHHFQFLLFGNMIVCARTTHSLPHTRKPKHTSYATTPLKYVSAGTVI